MKTKTCPECKGAGFRILVAFQTPCPTCESSGHVPPPSFRERLYTHEGAEGEAKNLWADFVGPLATKAIAEVPYLPGDDVETEGDLPYLGPFEGNVYHIFGDEFCMASRPIHSATGYHDWDYAVRGPMESPEIQNFVNLSHPRWNDAVIYVAGRGGLYPGGSELIKHVRLTKEVQND